jgi:hypothetical protein
VRWESVGRAVMVVGWTIVTIGSVVVLVLRLG